MPSLLRIGTYTESNASTWATSPAIAIPDGGVGILFAVTDTSITTVPTGWVLYDSGTFASLTWYRYVFFGARATIGSWGASGGGTLAAALGVWAYVDSMSDPVGASAPITIDDIVWGTISGATGDNCDAAPVTLPRSGESIAFHAGFLYPYNDGPPGTDFRGNPGWDTGTGPFAGGLSIRWTNVRSGGVVRGLDGEPHLAVSQSFSPVAYPAGATDDAVAHPWLSGVMVGAGEDNVGCQIAVLDYVSSSRFTLGGPALAFT